MIQNPFALTSDDVVEGLNSDSDNGLSKQEAAARLLKHKKNEIPEQGHKRRIQVFADQFADPIIYILAVATVLAFLFQDWAEGIAILVVILITVAIGYFMELQALRSLESLRKMGQTMTRVLRSGKASRIRASLLVPGDLILLAAGDVVTADARILQQENLSVKESSLTGESISTEKKTEKLPDHTLLSDQNNMVFKGTLVISGTARAMVTATGIHTQLGKIQQMGLGAKEDSTPLEKKLKQLSKWLIGLTLVLATLIVVTGYIKGQELFLMVQTGMALAVATIPEGLPIVATIALARGMVRLSKQHVVIKSLEAVETLGATNIICTDKTGTLTEDHLRVHTLVFDDKSIPNIQLGSETISRESAKDKALHEIMMTCILCNDIPLLDRDVQGDSVDMALLEFAIDFGFDPEAVQNQYPEKTLIPFDTERKMMATVNEVETGFHTYTKGAFEHIVGCCDTIVRQNRIQHFHNKAEWYEKVERLASQGLRTLAFAYKATKTVPEKEMVFKDLSFLGVTGFIDPAREDVKATMALYKNAGIQVVMMTGDHLGTAKKIAEETGLLQPEGTDQNVYHGQNLGDFTKLGEPMVGKLLQTKVFARVVPEQKLKLVSFYQRNNNIVGMIGDGINDVPALRKADIGIAMGIRGTEAAREAADMILENDKFTAIELAIHQGRVIYGNIRQFVVYLLSSNFAEIISVGVAALLSLPSPLLPLQILFLNLITDIFPALALGLGKGDKNVMQMPPRKPDEPIMTPNLWYATLIYGLSISAAVLGITGYAHFLLKLSPETINNMAFYTLILAQLLNVFNIPKSGVSFFKNEVTTNFWVWGAIVLCVLLTAGAAIIPLVAQTLSLAPLSLGQFGLIALFALGSLILAQTIKRVGGILSKSNGY